MENRPGNKQRKNLNSSFQNKRIAPDFTNKKTAANYCGSFC